MNELLVSIDQCLHAQNWYAAMAMALTVPDVCSALESADGKANGKLYAAWFDAHLRAKYGANAGGGQPWLTGSDCYALRCAFLHQSSDDISEQKIRDIYERIRIHESQHLLSIQTNFPTRLGVPNTLFIRAKTFCEDVCGAAREWLLGASGKEPIRSRLASRVVIQRGSPRL